ncbi:Nuclear protein localization protein [Actinidia chinensis var. chinensis]|uniref:Nuclear protein localization protein n=1 Tax=Actinidia chinensis var. chinensis TaxID=1590841 RepID=A0A2R6R9Y8_ACTCC|nr:Nuclear protein localization protein [Actinidia chinensis var. chinensis]
MAEETASAKASNELEESIEDSYIRSYPFHLRKNREMRREKVYIGCGAGFAGDRPLAALKLLQRVDLNYIILECLAERTFADRCYEKKAGGVGYDPRLAEWMLLLLPLAVEKGTCIITNMGAVSPFDAQEKVLEIASSLGISITVAMVNEFGRTKAALDPHLREHAQISTYLGAAPIVDCLDKYNPNVVITSRVADAALFLAPMVYELGWDWNELDLIAQGTLAGHLLECGCQLTGGYFMHPGDKYRDMPLPCLLDLSLPYAEVTYDGKVCVAKAESSGGALSFSTCAEQLLYEVGDPGAYITPDVIVDFRDVSFQPLSSSKVVCSGAKPSASLIPDKLLLLAPKDGGWRGWGEISYGGYHCVKRAEAAEFLVRSWMEERYPGTNERIISYIIGLDSLRSTSVDNSVTLRTAGEDIRLRMDGLFELEEHAVQFTREFIALYTNGPAGGGGISTGHKKEIILEKGFIPREDVHVIISSKRNEITRSSDQRTGLQEDELKTRSLQNPVLPAIKQETNSCSDFQVPEIDCFPALAGQKIPLYKVAHSRTGDKGNDSNFSLIPHFPQDVERLKAVITPEWVREVVSTLLNPSSFPDSDAISKRDQWVNENVKVEIYEARGIHSLNVVVRNILDGGVNCSRRIDRHGKTISDLILSQHVVLPP